MRLAPALPRCSRAQAGGILPELTREAGCAEAEETAVIATPTGSISLYRGVRPCGEHQRHNQKHLAGFVVIPLFVILSAKAKDPTRPAS